MHAGTGAPEPRFWQYRGSQDLAGLVSVRAAVRVAERTVWMPGPDTMSDPGGPGGSDGSVGSDGRAGPDPDGPAPCCLIAAVGDDVVGYTWADRWTEGDGTRLYLLLGWVVPAWRRHGIGSAMLRWQEEQALAHASTHCGARLAVLGGNADDDEHDTRALLLANGYQVAFTVTHLTRDLTGCPLEPAGSEALPAGVELRPVTERHHRSIHLAIEECFSDSSFGYVPRSLAEYRQDVHDRQSDTALWTVAWDGDQVAAVVINEIRANGTGLTPWVAVREPWRRRGIGRALMLTSLRRLSERGVRSTAISTIAENPHHAVDLYRSVGYQVTRRQPRYRKPMAEAFDHGR